VRRLSLNFSFLRAVLEAGSDVGLALRVARWGLDRLSRRFPIRSLYRFNKKFAPIWQPRYLAVQTAEDLAAVTLACLRAEGLLKHSAWAARSR
jgi:lysyl-tRNA synthetase class 2